MWFVIALLACSPSEGEEKPDPAVEPPPSTATAVPDTSPPTPPTDTAPDTGPSTDTGAPWDCAALPAPPLAAVPISGIPAAEDFAFDEAGNLIVINAAFFWKYPYPPAAGVAWAPATGGGGGGVASVRMLTTGDMVYHNVDTSTLYRVMPDASFVNVYSGFAYAGGIEVHPTSGWIYVVDITGIHRIEPYTGEKETYFEQAPWLTPNGITLSPDWQTLYISAYDGVWAVPVDADGVPNGDPSLWAPAPPGASDLMGMGTDDCGNVYVAGKTFSSGRVWRLPVGGGPAEVLLERPGGHLSNLQWGSGVGGWGDTKLYVVDQYAFSGAAYVELDVGVGEKPR